MIKKVLPLGILILRFLPLDAQTLQSVTDNGINTSNRLRSTGSFYGSGAIGTGVELGYDPNWSGGYGTNGVGWLQTYNPSSGKYRPVVIIGGDETDGGTGNYSLLRASYNKLTWNGNLGLGTLTPQARLHVNGMMRWGENIFGYFYSSHDGSGGYIEQVGTEISNSRLRLQSSKTGDTSNYAQFILDPQYGFSFMALGSANGNVGIGTLTPAEKLSVNGKIRAQEIKVEATNWPDYVFEPGFKVRNLEFLEEFIKENKHLPEIPSAAEVKAEGIELGEMNRILLKKIEELTLYLIEQNKAQNIQKNMVMKLTNRVDSQNRMLVSQQREITRLKQSKK